jgi:hypothetical protein
MVQRYGVVVEMVDRGMLVVPEVEDLLKFPFSPALS